MPENTILWVGPAELPSALLDRYKPEQPGPRVVQAVSFSAALSLPSPLAVITDLFDIYQKNGGDLAGYVCEMRTKAQTTTNSYLPFIGYTSMEEPRALELCQEARLDALVFRQSREGKELLKPLEWLLQDPDLYRSGPLIIRRPLKKAPGKSLTLDRNYKRGGIFGIDTPSKDAGPRNRNIFG